MSSFTNALILVDNEDGRTFTVYEDFTYWIGSLDSNQYRTVPKGFSTDLASKPRLLRRTGKYTRAAVLHDALYADPFIIVHYDPVRLNRKECDQIFLEAMLVCKVNRFKAYSYYGFVRAFGGRYFDNRRHG